jgi:murein DD-endopeptidase MepM/ murein hydrolase activator NlpD
MEVRRMGAHRRSHRTLLFVLALLVAVVWPTAAARSAAAVSTDHFAWPLNGRTPAGDVAWHQANEGGSRDVDIQAVVGTEVGAAQSGVVTVASHGCADSGSWGCGHEFGNYVVVRHDRPGVSAPLYTLYGHLRSSLAVSVGQGVVVGQPLRVIALSGSTTGGHTHFAISACSESWGRRCSRTAGLRLCHLQDMSLFGSFPSTRKLVVVFSAQALSLRA